MPHLLNFITGKGTLLTNDHTVLIFAGAPNCDSPCVTEQPQFAWNHGANAPDIAQAWLGVVGPGVRPSGVNGRVLSEVLDDWAVPQTLLAHPQTLI